MEGKEAELKRRTGKKGEGKGGEENCTRRKGKEKEEKEIEGKGRDRRERKGEGRKGY